MGRLVVSAIVSVDGFHTGPGNDVTVLPFDDGFSAYNVELLRAADVLVLGRRAYEGFVTYWPPVADDPAQPEVEREISRLNSEIDKVVVSDSMPQEPEGPWASTTTVVRRTDAHAHIAELTSGDDGDLLTFGSGTLANDLLSAGLVDELHLLVGPAVLGAGVPAFRGSDRRQLRLLETRRLPDSQLVLLRYAPSASVT